MVVGEMRESGASKSDYEMRPSGSLELPEWIAFNPLHLVRDWQTSCEWMSL